MADLAATPFNGPIVVVDVQPHYCSEWGDTEALMEVLNAHHGPCYMLVNAEETGVSPDTLRDCRLFWIENGLERQRLAGTRVIDKGYGYLRAWMDLGVDEDAIIAVIRRLRDDSLIDSREIDPDELRAIVGDEFRDWMLDDPVSIGWISEFDLEGMRNARLCGGAKDECLAEVELLLKAYGIPFHRMDDFVYSGVPTLQHSAPRR